MNDDHQGRPSKIEPKAKPSKTTVVREGSVGFNFYFLKLSLGQKITDVYNSFNGLDSTQKETKPRKRQIHKKPQKRLK